MTKINRVFKILLLIYIKSYWVKARNYEIKRQKVNQVIQNTIN